MNTICVIFMLVFGLFAGFVVGSSGPVGLIQGLICGAIAGALLSIPMRDMGKYMVLAMILTAVIGSITAVCTSDNNALKRTCGSLGLSIKIGNGKDKPNTPPSQKP